MREAHGRGGSRPNIANFSELLRGYVRGGAARETHRVPGPIVGSGLSGPNCYICGRCNSPIINNKRQLKGFLDRGLRRFLTRYVDERTLAPSDE